MIREESGGTVAKRWRIAKPVRKTGCGIGRDVDKAKVTRYFVKVIGCNGWAIEIV